MSQQSIKQFFMSTKKQNDNNDKNDNTPFVSRHLTIL